MRQKQTIPFDITGMDGLGQGVSKITGKVTFIPKTVIGDKGEAEIMAEKKGVSFARLNKLNCASPKRIEPECLHFSSCTSCHFLHISYEQELIYKKEAFEKLFRKLPLPQIEVIGAPQRLNYRNRIQLHYSLKSKLLGMRDSQTYQILPIPNCKIALKEVANEIKRLYENDHWIKEAPLAPIEGHLEIYWSENQLKVNWNHPYAAGGFTQVFEEMNLKLKDILEKQWVPGRPLHLLDLFAGNGNLSKGLSYSERLCVDLYSKLPGEDFLSQDLYDQSAIKNVCRDIARRKLNIRQMLLDPPRSGLKNIAEWISAIKPESLAYVSCDPHTLARDLQSLEGYSIKKAFLIDFFPSTFHFESLIFLERIS